MPDVLDVQAEVLNFREEARGCLQLAQAEGLPEVRTVLMGMAIGWLKLANGTSLPISSPGLTEDGNETDEDDHRFEAFSGVAGDPTSVPGMDDYYTIIAKAVRALHPNTEDTRRRLYERARAALLTELRSADHSDIMAAQMLLELAIGEVEAGAQGDQRSRRTINAPSMASPRSQPAHEPSFTPL
jgi:hypothetical protein